MSNLFKKALLFTDIHFGEKGNSKLHNSDCLEFVDWVIAEGKKRECDTCIFLGDWHHARASINIYTLKCSQIALEKLAAAFSQFFFIPGNHDLYYRERRDIQSVEWAKHIPGLTLVNGFLQEGDCAIIPWLVEGEHKTIKKIECKYMFGHFELPSFIMNGGVRMPDTGEIQKDDFYVEQMFTGHFHNRQKQGNVTYIGNAFPHSYSDVWDDDRGITILEWGGEPTFVKWPDAPRYRYLNLSEIVADPEGMIKPRTYAKVTVDLDLSYEERIGLKEEFEQNYGARDITLFENKESVEDHEFQGDINMDDVNTVVLKQLEQVESETFDNALLMQMWKAL